MKISHYTVLERPITHQWVAPILPAPISPAKNPISPTQPKIVFQHKEKHPSNWTTRSGERVLFPLGSSPKSEDIHTWALFHMPDSYTSFCASLICTTSLETTKVAAPNLPRVDEYCVYFKGTWMVCNMSCQESSSQFNWLYFYKYTQKFWLLSL